MRSKKLTKSEGSRLVTTDVGDTTKILERIHLAHDNMLLGHTARAKRHCQSQNDDEGLWNNADSNCNSLRIC